MRRTATVVAAVVVIGAAAGTTVWFTTRSNTTSAAPVTHTTATAKVTTRDLAIYNETNATLGYTTSVTVSSPVAGTVTSLITAGNKVDAGTVVASVDGAPVLAMFGGVPSYRDLSTGVASGVDVRQLEQNLVLLGYDPTGAITIDNNYDAATAAAVTLWENSLGLTGDGKVTKGEIVFVPGELLVDSASVSVGGAVAAGSPLVLGRQTARSFLVSAVGAKNPVITHIAAAGAAVKTGTELFRENGFPVVAIEGDSSAMPALARSLSLSTTDGVDVKLLEEMLVAGKWDKGQPITIDDHFDAATDAAVNRWWAKHGVTGDPNNIIVPAGSFVVVPGGLYVGTAKVADGATTVGNPVVTSLTTASRQVSTTAPVGDTTFVLGAVIDVQFPDLSISKGTITAIGDVATNASNTPGATPTVPITLNVDKVPKTYDSFVQIPVTLRVIAQREQHAFVVPVSALLALAEGGFGLEVVDSPATTSSAASAPVTHLIGVKTGLFADGFVTITGKDVKDGLTVVVPG
ncbi:MAG: peptidoglycan-binding domain-containing protein [Actinomycetota bacterium]